MFPFLEACSSTQIRICNFPNKWCKHPDFEKCLNFPDFQSLILFFPRGICSEVAKVKYPAPWEEQTTAKDKNVIS